MNLPNVYQNKDIIKSNNQTEYKISIDNINNKTDINSILKNTSFITKQKVTIELNNNKVLNKTIIGKTNKYLVTQDNKLIRIDEIKSIQKK